MNRPDGAKDSRLRLEGTPSVDGPKGGNLGGTAILLRPHIGMSAPRLPIGVNQDQNNLYEVIPGHLSAMVINGWTRSRFLAINVCMDVRSKLSTKNRGVLLFMGMPIVALGD